MIVVFIPLLVAVGGANAINDRPIIGVVTEELYLPTQNATSQIFASYVKFIEASGARVVPVWVNKTIDYYRHLLGRINGVLFPGGGVEITGTGYGRTGKIIFELANQMNDGGDHFPLWGTCLGFELLNLLPVKKLWMKACNAMDMATNLELSSGFRESKMFGELEQKLEAAMRNEKVAIHYHRWCLTPQNYSISGLDKYFKVLAFNRDSRNITFVSVIEARNYPYYGTAFHPEKVLFEWPITKTHRNSPHSLNAVRVSQYFGNFFVNEARKNDHHFESKEKEDALLIYNYNPVFVGKNNPIEQIYYFK